MNNSAQQALGLTLNDVNTSKAISKPLSLTVLGLGHVPSFKNNKVVIAKGPSGKPLPRPLLITKPEFQKWMKRCVDSFESQLLLGCQIGGVVIQAGRSKLCSIVLSLPADDSVNDLSQITLKVEHVPPGEEGASITIEALK